MDLFLHWLRISRFVIFATENNLGKDTSEMGRILFSYYIAPISMHNMHISVEIMNYSVNASEHSATPCLKAVQEPDPRENGMVSELWLKPGWSG